LALEPYTPEAEQFILNELANIFLRHRGERPVIVRFPIGQWLRTVVYPDALVSGSAAMAREIERLAATHGWAIGSVGVVQPPFSISRRADQIGAW
jgi:hypothetical protein